MKKNTYIGKEFMGKDKIKCIIVEDMEKNSKKQPSLRKYKVRFENGLERIYTYYTLVKGNFIIYDIDYIGKEFINEENLKCVIIEDIDKNSKKRLSDRNYKVRFENGLERVYSYQTLRKGIIKIYDVTHIGEEFISLEGIKCVIIEDVDKDNKTHISKHRYRVKSEDNREKILFYRSLRKGDFHISRFTEIHKSYIGRDFISKDGVKCIIIEDMDKNSNIVPCQRNYKVKCDIGVEKIYNYATLRCGNFIVNNSYIGREFISNNMKCVIIEDMEKDSNKMPSLRKYKVRFDNGLEKIYSYSTLRQKLYKTDNLELIGKELIGKEFMSKNGWKFIIIEDIDKDSNKPFCKHRCRVKSENGIEKIYLYSTLCCLKYRNLSRINGFNGKRFTNKFGDSCVIISELGHKINRIPSRRYYKVKFDDGTIDIINYLTLQGGTFTKHKQKDIDKFKYFKCKECGLEIYFTKELRIVHMIDWHGK